MSMMRRPRRVLSGGMVSSVARAVTAMSGSGFGAWTSSRSGRVRAQCHRRWASEGGEEPGELWCGRLPFDLDADAIVAGAEQPFEADRCVAVGGVEPAYGAVAVGAVHRVEQAVLEGASSRAQKLGAGVDGARGRDVGRCAFGLRRAGLEVEAQAAFAACDEVRPEQLLVELEHRWVSAGGRRDRGGAGRGARRRSMVGWREVIARAIRTRYGRSCRWAGSRSLVARDRCRSPCSWRLSG